MGSLRGSRLDMSLEACLLVETLAEHNEAPENIQRM